MSATSAPFGLRPAFHPTGLDRATALAGGIVSGYTSDILKGQPVKYIAASGVIQPVTATSDAVSGAFAGVEWTDTTGRRRVSNYWPANTAYQATLVATPLSTGTQGQVQILDVAPYPGNAWGDAYTIVRVQIARRQTAAVVPGI